MIGIDIGNKFIKVCKITKKDNKEMAVISAMKSVSNLDEASKATVLLELLEKFGVENEACFLGVGGKEIVTRDFIFSENKMNSKDLKDSLQSEFASSVSEDLSLMYTSHCLTRTTANKEYCILYSATPREYINAKLKICSGIKSVFVKGVNMEALALANSFVEFGPSYKNTESILLINVGYINSNMVVLNNKDLVFVKDIDFGGQSITKEIANTYVIPEKLAEEIKRREDLKQKIEFNMKNVLKRTASTLIESIFRTIEYCITRQFIVSLDRIVLTGGGAMSEGLDFFIEDTLGIPTTKWNPLEDNKIVGYSDKNCGYFLPVALGLALEKE